MLLIYMNKKGVSGIIVTILLILFIITVSGVAFNWIKGQTSGVMEQADIISEKLQACNDIDFEIEDAYCDGDVIIIQMTNNKNIDFKDAFSLELKAYESVEIQGLRQFEETNFGKNYFKIEEVEIVPRLLLNGKQVFCSENKQVLEARNC